MNLGHASINTPHGAWKPQIETVGVIPILKVRRNYVSASGFPFKIAHRKPPGGPKHRPCIPSFHLPDT
jgi:hypothetical protein